MSLHPIIVVLILSYAMGNLGNPNMNFFNLSSGDEISDASSHI